MVMKKFMCTHSFPPGAFSPDQVDKLSQAAQEATSVRGYRSFLNLSEGKALCVMEANDSDSVATWFNDMGMPYDNITEVELEGDRGSVQNVG